MIKSGENNNSIPIEKLKKGDFFKLSGKKSVYIFNGYNTSSRKYSFTKADDINSFGEKKKGTIVQTGFEY